MDPLNPTDPLIPRPDTSWSTPDHQPVTIPYFLYERMARAYYASAFPNLQETPLPPPSPDPAVRDGIDLAQQVLNQWGDFDVSPSWRPMGSARPRHKEKKNGGATDQAT